MTRDDVKRHWDRVVKDPRVFKNPHPQDHMFEPVYDSKVNQCRHCTWNDGSEPWPEVEFEAWLTEQVGHLRKVK